jgi:mRNA interferase RelE/StbE
MTYTVVVDANVEKDLRRVPKRDVEAIDAAISGLAINPRPPGAKPLSGQLKGKLRVRVGDYRIIYTVTEAIVTVHVLHVSHRSHVYR